MTTASSNGFEGKVVLVTGGGTGIGRAIVSAFADAGARVMAVGRREEPLRALAAEHSGHIAWQTGDVGRAEDIARLVAGTVKELGKLDILVNNAAVMPHSPLAETDDAAIDQALAVNFAGTLRMMRESLPHLSKSKGQIVNISSTVAKRPMPGVAVYAATKAAIEHATRVMAMELGAVGVRVNAVAPGATNTDPMKAMAAEMREMMAQQTPMGRLGEPEDIARAVLMVAREDVTWVTGQIIAASGGFML